jgi:hypothetical protein
MLFDFICVHPRLSAADIKVLVFGFVCVGFASFSCSAMPRLSVGLWRIDRF